MSFIRTTTTALLFLLAKTGDINAKPEKNSNDLICINNYNNFPPQRVNVLPMQLPETILSNHLQSKIIIDTRIPKKDSHQFKSELTSRLINWYKFVNLPSQCKLEELIKWQDFKIAVIQTADDEAFYDPSTQTLNIPKSLLENKCPEGTINFNSVLAHKLTHVLDAYFNFKMNKMMAREGKKSFALAFNWGDSKKLKYKHTKGVALNSKHFVQIQQLKDKLTQDISIIQNLLNELISIKPNKNPSDNLKKLFGMLDKYDYQPLVSRTPIPKSFIDMAYVPLEVIKQGCFKSVSFFKKLNKVTNTKSTIVAVETNARHQSYIGYFSFTTAGSLSVREKAKDFLENLIEKLELVSNPQIYAEEEFTYEIVANFQEIFSPYPSELFNFLLPNFYAVQMERATPEFKKCIVE